MIVAGPAARAGGRKAPSIWIRKYQFPIVPAERRPRIQGKRRRMEVFLSLDIGGTKILAAAADRDGVVRKTQRAWTPASLEEGLPLLKSLVRTCAGEAKILSMGASIGGPLDFRTGVVSPLHQPEWRAVPLKALMEREFGCPFHVDVDTNVAALGEWTAHRKESRRLLYLTISTGMGGGFIVDGRIYRGAQGEHPEVAHQGVPSKGGFGSVPCECGAQGCLESLVSGNGLRRLYGKPPERLSTEEWAQVGAHLGEGLRNLVTILVPDLISLGGGVALGAGERLLEPARKVAASSLKLVPFPRLELSCLGPETALRGGLVLAMEGPAAWEGGDEHAPGRLQ
jgi:predicted NBD/HSP70 family sugar kinase